MRLFKIRWWIPFVLVLFCAASFIWIDYYYSQRALELEKSTGLGAVADGIFFNPRSVPRQLLSPGVAMLAAPGSKDPSPIADPGYIEAAAQRLSTFSIDVDTASYTTVRRHLSEGHRPPKEMVRVEEMLNYFTYSYPDPTGRDPVSITTEVASCPWAPTHRLLRVGLKSKPLEAGNLPPSNLTFLIDVSGSMQGADRLPLIKRSFALLIEQLRPQDSVAIVVYAGAAGLVLSPTPGSHSSVIQEAIERLEAGGSTAGGDGIQLAYATARAMYRSSANNRVILATDGDFNVGVSSDEELIRLIEKERDHGIFLTVLGFGMDNLQDSKLEKLADHGNGHYAYVDTILEARRVFVEQLGATLQTVAKDVKVQADFNPARIRSYRLIGYDNRRLTTEEFRDDRKDAGDIGAGHTVTALYELVPLTGDPLTEEAFTVRVRYKPPESRTSVEMTVSGSAETNAPSPDFRFAASVAEFGMLLSDSAYKGESSFASAIALAESGTQGDGKRAEFVAQLRQAAEI